MKIKHYENGKMSTIDAKKRIAELERKVGVLIEVLAVDIGIIPKSPDLADRLTDEMRSMLKKRE